MMARGAARLQLRAQPELVLEERTVYVRRAAAAAGGAITAISLPVQHEDTRYNVTFAADQRDGGGDDAGDEQWRGGGGGGEGSSGACCCDATAPRAAVVAAYCGAVSLDGAHCGALREYAAARAAMAGALGDAGVSSAAALLLGSAAMTLCVELRAVVDADAAAGASPPPPLRRDCVGVADAVAAATPPFVYDLPPGRYSLSAELVGAPRAVAVLGSAVRFSVVAPCARLFAIAAPVRGARVHAAAGAGEVMLRLALWHDTPLGALVAAGVSPRDLSDEYVAAAAAATIDGVGARGGGAGEQLCGAYNGAPLGCAPVGSSLRLGGVAAGPGRVTLTLSDAAGAALLGVCEERAEFEVAPGLRWPPPPPAYAAEVRELVAVTAASERCALHARRRPRASACATRMGEGGGTRARAGITRRGAC